MARIRALKPEAFQSETLGAVSVAAERTFFGMSTQADDRGRLPDKAAVLNGQLWPYRPEHTALDLEDELVELDKAGAICRYVGCDGKRYLHLIRWDSHQKIEKPSKSRLPRCPRHLTSSTLAVEKCGANNFAHENAPCPTPFPDSSPNIRGGVGEASVSPPTVFTPTSDAPGEQVEEAQPPSAGPAGADDRPSGNGRSEAASGNVPRSLGEASGPGSRILDLGSRTLDRGSTTRPTAPDAHVSSASQLTIDGSVEQPATSPAKNAKQPRRYPEGHRFDEFYKIYPRREAKQPGLAAWNKAIERAEPDDIIAGARRYAWAMRNSLKQHVALPASWLNADRWTDELPPVEAEQPNAAVGARVNGHSPYQDRPDRNYFEGL